MDNIDWESEAKRAFWAGLEIGASFGSCAILPRWNEYIAKRKSELPAPNAQGAAVPDGWLPIESVPFNTPVLVSDEKIIASMFFYRPEESHRAEDQFNGGGWEGVRVSLIKNGCHSKLKWWRPMLEIPNENTVTSHPLTPKE